MNLGKRIQLRTITVGALRTQDLDKQMYCLQIRELIIVCVDAHTEEQASVAAVNNFVVAELALDVSFAPPY